MIKPLGDRVVIEPSTQQEKNRKWNNTTGHSSRKTARR